MVPRDGGEQGGQRHGDLVTGQRHQPRIRRRAWVWILSCPPSAAQQRQARMRAPTARGACRFVVQAGGDFAAAAAGCARAALRNVMYIDSDAFILNASMSIDEYLERARSVGDEAVQDARWELLLSSDFPYRGAGPCAGVFWVKNSPDGCSIMRAWWDWPSSPHLLKPWDQGAVNEFYVRARPFGDRVRVLPTGRFFHFVMGTASPADPWLVHVLARHRERHAQAVARLLSAALRAARGVRRSRHGDVGGEGGLPDPCEHAGESALFDSQALGALLARARASGACPPAQRGVDSLGRRLPQTVTEGRGGAQLRPQRTHLNGTALAAPSPAPSREGLLTWMLRSLRGRKRDAPSSPAPLRPCWRGEGRNNESQLWSCWERWWEDVGLRFAEQQRQWLRWQMHKGAHALASLKSAALFPRVQRPHGARALAVTHTPHAAKKPESGAAAAAWRAPAAAQWASDQRRDAASGVPLPWRKSGRAASADNVLQLGAGGAQVWH
eukprot:CAMPEP_0119421188 /NCGR_PEP_ID=MMETSP1335-20130426/25338_1 /TAXON_ID=259385 /ORGANISM="Chrysoculter rhomboideus, Strain RCC1486" /LENGTH=496 /DNA_ID=CAMNT_0007446591 /DNA_START=80 /DNA_END=1570 /DNA_ORIENTATION=+